MPTSAGHRIRPHPADLIVQAWAPSAERCLVEAVCALVGSFADVGHVPGSGQYAFDVRAGGWADRLAAVFDEVLFLLDARDEVPVATQVATRADGTLHVTFELAPLDHTEAVGSAPKGVSRSGLVFEQVDSLWRCSAIVDV